MATDEAEELALRRLQYRLSMLETLIDQRAGRHWDLANPASPLAVDDESLGPYKLSHLVGHCLSLAFDGLQATHALMVGLQGRGEGMDDRTVRIPMAAHYPMLRSATESSALAVWLLSPDDSHERRTRVFRAHWDDLVQDKRLMLAITESEFDDEPAEVKYHSKLRQQHEKVMRTKKARLREVASLAQVNLDDVYLGLPGFEAMVGDATSRAGLRRGYGTGQWRLVSGLSHPSSSRSIMASNIEQLGDSNDGSVRALFTARTDIVNNAVESAFLMYREASELVAIRGNNRQFKFRLPDGFPLPPGYEHLAPQPHQD